MIKICREFNVQAPRMKIKISFKSKEALSGIRRGKKAFHKAINTGIEKATKVLLRDCRPYIPMLTGKLRDSGRIEKLENYAFQLVWDAANLGFMYAKRQYEEIFQHVDGRYAAEWVKKTLDANPNRYQFMASMFVKSELAKVLKECTKVE